MPHIAPERLPELELFKELAPQTEPELVWLLRSRSYLAHLSFKAKYEVVHHRPCFDWQRPKRS
ncbi:hypothetical protein J6590_046296 [Homalodisca vitripennis]|nr:hypothetical protein J6590_046296 [Homalodisca vitripennis]